ncbi:MAG: hypothetical protein JWN33_168 [Candidatus Saccharibacteria bacterium]|nr:hypothetical protein [Candidatus Saccharibacteria bacterium]
MFLVGILSWWYGKGLRQQAVLIVRRLQRLADDFSIVLSLKTLFAPFRQISASRANGSIAVMWQAFVDRMVSRVIGFIVRSMTILVGVLLMVLLMFYGVVLLVVWLLIPLFPVVGLILWVIGKVPSWL